MEIVPNKALSLSLSLSQRRQTRTQPTTRRATTEPAVARTRACGPRPQPPGPHTHVPDFGFSDSEDREQTVTGTRACARARTVASHPTLETSSGAGPRAQRGAAAAPPANFIPRVRCGHAGHVCANTINTLMLCTRAFTPPVDAEPCRSGRPRRPRTW